MRVWITGGRGFVGAHLARRLHKENCTLLGEGEGGEARARAELNVCDADAVRRFCIRAQPNAVVHLAALSSAAAAARAPLQTWRVNYLGARHVLEAALHMPRPPRVLLVSSSLVYGESAAAAPPLNESAPLRPRGVYAAAKAAADLLAAQYRRRGLEVLRLRPFNHTGAGRAAHFAEAGFAKQLAQIELGLHAPVIETGNLNSARDFLHVHDVTDAYRRLLAPEFSAQAHAPDGVFNIAGGRALRLGELLQGLMECVPQKVREQIRVTTRADLWRPAGAQCGDARRLRAATGWRPQNSLQQICETLMADWRARVRAARP